MELAQALDAVAAAAEEGKISAGAEENIRKWLTEPAFAEYVPSIEEHIANEQWEPLNDAFYEVLVFGTGGRRGRMYPIGCNRINDRTIGESARGLATYVAEQNDGPLSCAIAYDTRHRSRHFAELCAGIMVAAGFKVYLLDEHRSTPELSFLVRNKQCSCGIMVTASHNPPSDNAVKVYWRTGGQILPPHDRKIIEEVGRVGEIEVADFEQAVADGKVEICTEATDQLFVQNVVSQSLSTARDIKVIYSPLHGVGATAVSPVFAAAGFQDVEIFAPHAEPSGDFPNVPGNVSNPENPAVFDDMIAHAQQTGAELVIASDPDCDRLGVAAPLTLDSSGPWGTFNGNQIGALLADHVMQQKSRGGSLHGHYIVTTLVSTKMMARIAESYGVRCEQELLVGFKWICGRVDELGPERYLYGCEESHGYAVGQYARDKDGAVASLLLAELAAQLKQDGTSLHAHLDSLYWQHGYHGERLASTYMEGQQGMQEMAWLMERFRSSPPKTVAGLEVVSSVGYSGPEEGTTPIQTPDGDLMIFQLSEPGNYFAVRPSGTEPKVKFYMFTYVPAEQLHDLDAIKDDMNTRLDQMAADLEAYSQQN